MRGLAMTITSLFRVSVLSVMVLCGVVAFDQAAPGIFLAEAAASARKMPGAA